jgi:hypothetical protein
MTATRECDSCGAERECDSANPTLISDGLILPFRSLGYYGGFVDDFPWEELDDLTEVFNICGDCVVTMLRALPGVAQKLIDRYAFETNIQSRL